MFKINTLSTTIKYTKVLEGISCDLALGQIVALLGPSGSGKTTLLRSIARLEKIPVNRIFFNDQEIHTLSPTQIGMVFQNFNLFPHMTVLENLCYAVSKKKKLTKADILKKAHHLLKEFGLSNKQDVYPSQLSGGQKQRVAIMRTLMLDPDIILFDEPTSALDPETVTEIAHIIQKLKSPHRLIIMATHELRICQLIADHILFLDHGKLVENQEKKAFFAHPTSARAKIFLENRMIQ